MCSNPNLAIDFGVNPLTGKHSIKFLKRNDSFTSLKDKFGDNLLMLPCGKCLECRKAKAQEWAVRCYLESKYHLDNCFITLTYDDAHLPPALQKKDLQLFLKRLRNRVGSFRYFACGEYGELTSRSHFHILIFGFVPNDLREIGTTDKGSKIFSSDIISSCWTFGFSSIGLVEPASICYVAQYNTKKLNSSDLPKKYKEFITMSRRPGLGQRYILENIEDICSDKGSLYLGDFGIKNSSRYILNMIKNFDSSIYEAIKSEKIANSKKLVFDKLYKSGCSNLNEYYIHTYKLGLDAEKRSNRKF